MYLPDPRLFARLLIYRYRGFSQPDQLSSENALAAAISRKPLPLLAATHRRQIDDFAVGPDNGNPVVSNVPFAGDLPPGYPDPPAYTALPLDDPSLLPDEPVTATGRLHPRAAVILGLKNHWHKWLFFCRLLSVFPELRFGIPMLWNLAWFLLGRPTTWRIFGEHGDPVFVFVEALMAALWCAVSGYVSFFSMDLLMVRWLFRYTPMASIVRLITASFLYYLGTNWVLELSGSRGNVRRLLPAWVLIATVRLLHNHSHGPANFSQQVLAIIYLTMHDKAAIKREDRSMIVFAAASFITMWVLLGLLHLQS